MKRIWYGFILLGFVHLYGVKLGAVSDILGVRDNQLIGYGLIVGLDGTGDGNLPYTVQALASMLESVDMKVDVASISSKNIAAVVLTATLPPFARHGSKLDVVVSSIGDAGSLRGGNLLLTPLKGIDGQVYALAQGVITIPSNNPDQSDVRGVIANGAMVEREVEFKLDPNKKIILTLKHPNFGNAKRTQDAINEVFNFGQIAKAIDAKTIAIDRPPEMGLVDFVADLQVVNVHYNAINKMVVDSKTGTIIAGLDVEVEPVLVTHGDITVKISSNSVIVPSDKDIGDGVEVDREANLITTAKKPTVAGVARALQKMGATPKDVIAIFTAMKRSGALVVDLEVI